MEPAVTAADRRNGVRPPAGRGRVIPDTRHMTPEAGKAALERVVRELDRDVKELSDAYVALAARVAVLEAGP
jgi:hypothetical protein